MISASFDIPSHKIASLQGKMDKLNRIAIKLNTAPIIMTIGQTFVREIDFEYEHLAIQIKTVTIVGETPMIEGWQLMGMIEHTVSGNLLRTFGDESLPEKYRTSSSDCDHCHKIRNRNNSYILRGEDGEYKQVGSSCLADFTGSNNPERIAQFYTDFSDLLADCEEEYDEREGSNLRSHRLTEVKKYLSYVALAIRLHGWTSKQTSYIDKCESTSEIATDMMYDINFIPEFSVNDTTLVDLSLGWIRAMSGEEVFKSEYLSNLQTVCAGEYTERKQLGLVASLITSYQRHIEKLTKDSKPVMSGYIGEVGGKVQLSGNVEKIIEIEGQYGTTYLCRIRTTNNNLVVWFASNPKFEEGDEVTLKATVKGQEVYQGQEQTIITRAKAV
jgi:hypothetical protein